MMMMGTVNLIPRHLFVQTLVRHRRRIFLLSMGPWNIKIFDDSDNKFLRYNAMKVT